MLPSSDRCAETKGAARVDSSIAGLPRVVDHLVDVTRWLDPGHVGEEEDNALVIGVVVSRALGAEACSSALDATNSVGASALIIKCLGKPE